MSPIHPPDSIHFVMTRSFEAVCFLCGDQVSWAQIRKKNEKPFSAISFSQFISLHMEVVSIAERSTEQFVSLFYEQYDKQRNVSVKIILDSACHSWNRCTWHTAAWQPVSWQLGHFVEWYAIEILLLLETLTLGVVGNAFSGASQFAEFLSRLPASQHEITAYDCQPIAGTVSPM